MNNRKKGLLALLLAALFVLPMVFCGSALAEEYSWNAIKIGQVLSPGDAITFGSSGSISYEADVDGKITLPQNQDAPYGNERLTLSNAEVPEGFTLGWEVVKGAHDFEFKAVLTPIQSAAAPSAYTRTYDITVACEGPGASNVKGTREVDAGSVFRVKFYPEEGARLLSLTVNGEAYDPALLKAEGEALIYGISRVSRNYVLEAVFGEPVAVELPEAEVMDAPKTGGPLALPLAALLFAAAAGLALCLRRA